MYIHTYMYIHTLCIQNACVCGCILSQTPINPLYTCTHTPTQNSVTNMFLQLHLCLLTSYT